MRSLLYGFVQPKYAINLGGLIIPIALGLISMAVHHNNEGQLEGFVNFVRVNRI